MDHETKAISVFSVQIWFELIEFSKGAFDDVIRFLVYLTNAKISKFIEASHATQINTYKASLLAFLKLFSQLE